MKGKPVFIQPAKINMANHKKNSDKYCYYHQDKEQNSDECFHLKRLIEKIIKAEEINEFLRDPKDKLGPNETRNTEP